MPTFNRIAKWARKLLGRGANRDIRPELLPDGLYADGFNVRPASISGNDGGVEAVKGEKLIYEVGLPNGNEWVCIGSAQVNGRVMDFWCHPEPQANLPIVTIDGTIVAQSAGIPYTFDRPLQLAVVEACGEGVVYPADHQSPPLFWSVSDLLGAIDTPDYFADYSTEVNSVALSAPPQFPRHTANIDIGTGLPAGQYSYALRYESPAGDKTNIGPETPLISVALVHDFVWNNTAWPGARTTGRFADATTATRYGIQLQFRIDNIQGFRFVEVVRRAFNNGQGLNGIGNLSVVARIELISGENRVVTFTDPADSNANLIVTPDEEADRALDINAPKSVEYADNRLSYLNFSTPAQDVGLTFREVGDTALFPITSKVTTFQDGAERNSGYCDPVNNTYKRSYMRGEKYGLAIQPWTGNLFKPFAIPVPGTEEGGYQMPNRRDRKTGDSATYSDSPIYAALTDCQSASPVDQTFDAFTQGTYRKSDTQIVNAIASSGAYEPWRPVNPTDNSIEGLRMSPIVGYSVGQNAGVDTTIAMTGNIWNPQYNALGVGIYGIENVPSSVKAMTVVRTAPANRVICQGIGTYRLTEVVTAGFPIHKSTTSVDFFSRDLQLGLVPQNIREDMEANPRNYELQFVSPLGFFTECYGYFVSNPLDRNGNGIDMVSYAGIQHDEGQVNAGEPAAGGMGYQPQVGVAPAGNYVGYSAWRQTRPPTNQGPPTTGSSTFSYWNQTGNDGNTPYTLDAFQQVTTGRGTKWILTTGYIYSPATDSTDQTNFLFPEVRAFHQPWYVINIVRRGAEVPQGTGDYVNTGTTIMTESCVGISNGAASQTYQLLNERIEDVLGTQTTDFRYVWVKAPGAPPGAWVCISNNTVIDPATVLQSIADTGSWTAPDGTVVFGIYTAEQLPGQNGAITFGTWGSQQTPAPVQGSRILVRYNKLAPIKAFGGDVTIAQSTHAIVDGQYVAGQTNNTALAINGLPLPYPGFVRNPLYNLPFTSFAPQVNFIVYSNRSLRQWCVMYDCETRTQSIMGVFNQAVFDDGSMVRTHYTMMPYGISPSGAFAGFHPQYLVDYPWAPEMISFGGLRFLDNAADSNTDYWKQPLPSSIGLPEGGPTTTSDYCAAIAASLERDPAVDSSPGARTFLASNVCYLSEENGEGKILASALGPNGQNMYVWTQSGVCRVLTNKSVLTGADGAVVATQNVSNYWADQMWISRDVGCPDQMWRLFAKGYAPVANNQRADSFFWADRNGFYRMVGDSIIDISRSKYLSELKSTLQFYPDNYSVPSTAFYNQRYNEVWFSIDQQVVPPRPVFIPTPVIFPKRLFVFSPQTGEWVGKFGYDFDEYVMLKDRAWGKRDLQTYLLDEDYTISGDIRTASVTVPLIGDMGILKEFTRWAITGTKPDEVEILDSNYNVICRQNEAIAALFNPAEAQYWVLKYSKGWEQWAAAINIVDGVYSPTDVRPQDEFFFLRITWNSEGDKQVVALSANYQNIL